MIDGTYVVDGNYNHFPTYACVEGVCMVKYNIYIAQNRKGNKRESCSRREPSSLFSFLCRQNSSKKNSIKYIIFDFQKIAFCVFRWQRRTHKPRSPNQPMKAMLPNFNIQNCVIKDGFLWSDRKSRNVT